MEHKIAIEKEIIVTTQDMLNFMLPMIYTLTLKCWMKSIG